MRNLLIFIIVLAVSGCSGEDSCKNVICTAMFAAVTVNLSDTSNQDLTGISTQTALSSTGKIIHVQSGPNNFPVNTFTVADDSDLEELGFMSNQKVELKISKDGQVIKKTSFTIKTDCCHISKTEGPEEVSLN